MELKKIKEGIYYIPNVTNIGVLVDQGAAVLVDSGLDQDAAKKILKCLEAAGLTVKAIVNTHSHADHIGGNRWIHSRTGAKIYAPELETGLVQTPYLEPLYLFSGAEPISDLKSKYYMAPESRVDSVIGRQGGALAMDGLALEAVPLPGHSPGQMGIAVGGVLFCGDAVFSAELMTKHRLPFCVDLEKQFKTLDWLEASRYEWVVPSHGEPSADAVGLCGAYRERVEENLKLGWELLGEERTAAGFLKGLCDRLAINMSGKGQYFLNNTVAMAYLSYLYNQGRLEVEVKDNTLFWRKKEN